MIDLLAQCLGLRVIRVGLEDAVERRLGGVALAQAKLGFGELDLEVIGPLGLELQGGLVLLDRWANLSRADWASARSTWAAGS